jgi:outer membrane protein assembly factor BamB
MGVWLLCGALVTAQERQPGPTPVAESKLSKFFEEAKQASEGSQTSFEFELSGFTYRISTNGAGRRIKGDSTRRFNLRLEGGDDIKRVYFAEYRDNVLLLCTVNDGSTGTGFIMRLEQPSMRSRWKRYIPSDNVGPVLVEDGQAYLTGRDFVARLDLRSGEYIWQHEDLQREDEESFSSFELPEIEGDAVLFRESAKGESPARTVRVNRKNGKIKGIE